MTDRPSLHDVPEHLRFQVPPPPDKAPKPIPFALEDEVFVCLPDIAGTAIMEHERAMTANQNSVVVVEVLNYFERCMEPDEYRRFREYVDAPRRRIGLPLLANIMFGLHAEYLRRPTNRPSTSPDGPGTTGSTSTDDSPSPE